MMRLCLAMLVGVATGLRDGNGGNDGDDRGGKDSELLRWHPDDEDRRQYQRNLRVIYEDHVFGIFVICFVAAALMVGLVLYCTDRRGSRSSPPNTDTDTLPGRQRQQQQLQQQHGPSLLVPRTRTDLEDDVQWALNYLNGNGNGARTTPQTTARYIRMDLVKECLEFRTIGDPTPRSPKKAKKKRKKKKKKAAEARYDDHDDEGLALPKKKTKKKKQKRRKRKPSNDERDPELGDDDKNNNNNNDAEDPSVGNNNNNNKHYDDDDDDDPSLIVSATTTTDPRRCVVPIDRIGSGSWRWGWSTRAKGETCAICLEPFRVGDKVARMKNPAAAAAVAAAAAAPSSEVSPHWFKEDCILEWLQSNDECPLSRIKIVPTR